MRRLIKNNSAVSNLIAYMFSIGISAMIMTGSLAVTNAIIDDKITSVAEIEAQNVANYISNVITEAALARQSMPDAEFSKKISIPGKLAGRNYYIEVQDNQVWVRTTDGKVTKRAATYTLDDLDIGIADTKIYGDASFNSLSFRSNRKIEVSAFKSEPVFYIDFGAGDSLSHSPVEANYYFGTNETFEWLDSDSPYRVPIKIKNKIPEKLEDYPVKIVLDPLKFDYDKAMLYPESNPDYSGEIITDTNIFTDIRFVEKIEGADVQVTASNINDNKDNKWYNFWVRTGEKITIDISDFSGGYTANQVLGSTVRANIYQSGGVKCEQYYVVEGVGKAVFDAKALFSTINFEQDKQKTITITGLLNGGTEEAVVFSGEYSITTLYGDIIIDPSTSFSDIKSIIINAAVSTTIYIKQGTYGFDQENPQGITISKSINIVGEEIGNSIPIFKVNKVKNYCFRINANDVNIISLQISNTGSHYQPLYAEPDHGLVIHEANNVKVINCIFNDNEGDGIVIQGGSKNCLIKDCIFYNNRGTYDWLKWPNEDKKFYRAGSGVRILGPGTDYNTIMDSKFYWTAVSYSTFAMKGISIEMGAQYNNITDCHIYDMRGDRSLLYPKLKSYNDYPLWDIGNGISIHSDENINKGTSFNNISGCIIEKSKSKGIDGIQIGSVTGNINEKSSIKNIVYKTIIRELSGSSAGIYLDWVNHTQIIDCTISYCGVGIFAIFAVNSYIKNCDISYSITHTDSDKTGDGIYLDSACNYNIIEYSKIHNNQRDGIKIFPTFVFLAVILSSENNSIQFCEIYNNGYEGVEFTKAILNTISFCNIYDNKHGISIWGGYQLGGTAVANFVLYNNIYHNKIRGIWIDSLGTFNYIFSNNIYCNGYQGAFSGDNIGAGILLDEQYGLGCAAGNVIWRNNFMFNGRFFGGVFDPTNAVDRYPNSPRCPFSLFTNVFNWSSSLGSQGDVGNYWHDDGGVLYPIEGGSCTWETNDWNPNDGSGTYETYGVYYYPIEGFYKNPDIIFVNTDWPLNPVYGDQLPDSFPTVHWYHTDTVSEALSHVRPGGTIYVYPGTYNEPDTITIDKTVKIVAVNKNSKPIIKVQGDKPVFNITGLSQDEDMYEDDTHFIDWFGDIVNLPEDYKDNTIYLDSLKIQGGNSGIYINDTLNCPSNEGTSVKISNCDISNVNGPGIYINDDKVKVENCNIWNNNYGINYSAAYCKVENCIIKDNVNSGIIFNYGHFSQISGCIIKNNQDGGIKIVGGSSNLITNCEISNNQGYGINIDIGSANTIYHNFLTNNLPKNARDTNYGFANTWYSTELNQGNRWGDFDTIDDGVIDLFSGPDQDELGSDGVVDKGLPAGGREPYPHFEGFVDDRYPLIDSGQEPDVLLEMIETKKFYVDYWNPFGESVIYTEVTLNPYEERTLFLYYGSGIFREFTGSVLELDNKKGINPEVISIFFEDFSDRNKFNTNWYYYKYDLGGGDLDTKDPYISPDGILTIEKDYYLMNKVKQIISPDTPEEPDPNFANINDGLYILEARVKINNTVDKNQINMIILNDHTLGVYQNSYVLTAYYNPQNPNNLSLHKPEKEYNKPISTINFSKFTDDWYILRSYIYVTKNCYNFISTVYSNATQITAFLLDFNTSAETATVQVQDGWHGSADPDNDGAVGPPYLGGGVGLGCGLMEYLTIDPDAAVLVDWIKLMKILPEQPEVTIGSKESYKFRWSEGGTPTAVDIISQMVAENDINLFKPGPLLRDFVGNDQPSQLSIKGLEEGYYTITVIKGNISGQSPGIEVKCIGEEITLIESEAGVFSKGFLTIEKKTGSDVELSIQFNGHGGSDWILNALLIDKGFKEIKIMEK